MVNYYEVTDNNLHILNVRVAGYEYDVHVQLGHVEIIPIGSKTEFDVNPHNGNIKGIVVNKNVQR